ncbi:MAG: hypothetical protein Q9184_006639, partial [Pyrenodesmia sp. 2 TL-2023]
MALQNKFLKDLQYNFEFHRWSDLFAMTVKARSQADNLDDLLQFFACRGDQLNARMHNTGESEASSQARFHFMSQVKGVVEKINVSVAVLEEARARKRKQMMTIHNEAVPGLVPIELE